MQQTAYSRMMYERQRRKMAGKTPRRSKTVIDLAKNCFRKIITFLFTQIGVAALLIGYNVIGAFAFQSLEGQHGDSSVEDKAGRALNDTIKALWNLTLRLNLLDEYTWKNTVHSAVGNYQNTIIPLIRDKGYIILYPQEKWTFSASMMYCLSIYTTIGYGFITPRTVWGKITTIFYAMLGLPLMLLYMSCVGEILARVFKFVYFRACHCGNDSSIIQKEDTTNNRKNSVTNFDGKMDNETVSQKRLRKSADIAVETIPIIWCLCVIGIYVFIGGLLFAHFEGWTTLDGCYFCYISLSTIGYGDIVPGGIVVDSGRVNETLEIQQILLSVYLLVGMSLVAMCFNLMQEEALQNLKAFWRGIVSKRKNNLMTFRKPSILVQDSNECQAIQLQPLSVTNVEETESKEQQQNDE